MSKFQLLDLRVKQTAERRARIKQNRTGIHRDHRDALHATRSEVVGRSCRSICQDLPAVTPNGTSVQGMLVCCVDTTLTEVAVAWHTVPSSAAGTITLTIKRVHNGVTTEIVSAVDVESLSADTPKVVARNLKINRHDYVFCELVSDNADAVDGTGGVVSFLHKTKG